MIEQRDCPHCPWMKTKGIFHGKTCRCDHHHVDHTSFGACKIAGCDCTRYDQSVPAQRVKAPNTDPALVKAMVEDIKGLEHQIQTNVPGEMTAKLYSVKKLRALAKAQQASE